MKETKERFFVFIAKLEEKLRAFADESIPALIEVNNSDTDEYKREYLRLQAAVYGQLDSIIDKARKVHEEKIIYSPFNRNDYSTNAYYEFREQCNARFNQLDELYKNYRDKIAETYQVDYEIKYQNILAEYEAEKNKFHCTQCGSQIPIEKIYFTTTYIACSSCGTQNTFQPSSQAKNLEHLGRSLAEQRTRHLLKEYEAIPAKANELYMQGHGLSLSLIHEMDRNIIQQKKETLLQLEEQQNELEAESPVLYQQYLRAMFDEWNKINPDMQTEHEKFYQQLLTENKTQQR